MLIVDQSPKCFVFCCCINPLM